MKKVPWTDLVEWKDSEGHHHTEAASPALTTRDLARTTQIRRGKNYPGRPHFEGLYWFSGTAAHVWHESMLEHDTLLVIDFRGVTRSISAQPFQLKFTDGLAHVPDYFLEAVDGTQSVVDVRPLEHIDDDFLKKAEDTRRVCDAVGWTYEIHTGQPPVIMENLRWLSAYRFPTQAPSADLADQILSAADNGRELRDVVDAVDIPNRGHVVPNVFNLMWSHALVFDLRHPLSWATQIRRDDDARRTFTS
jgi:hypothetical protein